MMKKNDDASLVRILGVGFKPIGEWKLIKSALVLDYLSDHTSQTLKDSSPALYAHVVDDVVKYAGKTAQPLHKRLYGYQRPGGKQKTNLKCHEYIIKEIKKGKSVVTYGYAPDNQLAYGEFSINLAAGLEDDLIEKLDPEWNGRQIGGLHAVSESVENEHVAQSCQNVVEIQNDLVSRESAIGRFKIKLGTTYYNTGFINPGAKVDQLLGKHNQEILVRLGPTGKSVYSIINRSANLNRSARIMARKAVADWFKANYKLNDVVKAEVLSPQMIILHEPLVNVK